MRTLALTLLLAFVAVPVYAQADSTDFFAVVQELDTAPETVQDKAVALAKTNDYLDTATPAGDPTALLPGDLQLRIDGAPFTLYFQPTDRHTQVKLESRRLDLRPEAKKKAEAFLQELARSVATNHG